MWIDVKSLPRLAELDTIILASDGLWDNLYRDEVAKLIGNPSLIEVAHEIARMAAKRMKRESVSGFGKPDDLSFILYRPHRRLVSETTQLELR